MKRLLGIACTVAMAAPLAFGQASVFSQNAVGYVRVNVPRGVAPLGGLALVRLDFEPLDPLAPNNTINVLGDQVPTGSRVHVWRSDIGGTGGYCSETKTRSGWPASCGVIERGEAFWIEIPPAAAEPSYNVYLMGEVPGANNDSETLTINVATGIDAVGYPYPAAIAWADTTIAAPLPAGARIHFWNISGPSAQSYTSHTKTRSGWPTAALDTIIEPGTAFWIENPGAAVDWTEAKPYAWP